MLPPGAGAARAGVKLVSVSFKTATKLTTSGVVKGSVRSAEKSINSSFYKAGTYKELDSQYKLRRGIYEINHVPSDKWNAMNNGPKRSLGPAIAMDYADHRGFITTGRQNSSLVKSDIAKGLSTKDVVIRDLKATLDPKYDGKYEQAVREYIRKFPDYQVGLKDVGL